MKIAISMVSGPLHKWGYQHVCRECIASQAEFADHVYLVQSTEDASGTRELLDEYSNVTLISDPSTWHHRPGKTDEKLTVAYKIVEVTIRNLAIGRLAAFRDGYEVVMSTDNNWYIPRRNVNSLRDYCERFHERHESKSKVWGLLQLCDKLFGPFYGELLSNLAWMDEGQIGAHLLDTKLRLPAPNTIPENINEIHFVDCNYEMYPEECGANLMRFPDYGCETWDWPAYLAGRVARLQRFNLQKPLDIPLDYWGQRIAEKSQPDFMSYQILKAAGFNG